MTGVRLPSRLVRTDNLRGLFFVAALLAVGVGYRGHGLQGAAKSKSDSKFVDPFLEEDIAAPGDDEIPRIPDQELPRKPKSTSGAKKPSRNEKTSDPEDSSEPPLTIGLDSGPEAEPEETGPRTKPDTERPADRPSKNAEKRRRASEKLEDFDLSLPELETNPPQKKALKSGVNPDSESDTLTLPELDLDDDSNSRSMPQVQVP